MPVNTSVRAEVVEFDFYISPDGEEYNFNNYADKFILGVSGRGTPPIDYLVQSGPFQHGVTILDYRLEPRSIQLIHRRDARDRDKYWDMRADILNLLRPNRQAVDSLDLGVLRKILPNGNIRDIGVLIEQGPEFKLKDVNVWDEWAFTEVLRFFAPDPTFFDPTQKTITFALSELFELVFPIDFPIEFSGELFQGVDTLAYLGTWLDYPIIEIDGPLSSPSITNVSTGEVINMAYEIPAGRTVTFNLLYGEKTVEDDLGVNLIGTVTPASDLGTFHIAPDPEAADGDNVLTVSGTDAVFNETAVRINYFDRYIGI